MTIHFQHDLDDDHSGLVAWVDGRGQFFAVGEDDVAREYGDGDEERLRADLQPAAPSPVARHVALMRQQWRTAMNEYLEAEYSDISHLPEHEQEKAFDRAGLALDTLVGTRAADLTILAEKMRVIDKTGTYQASGYWEDLLEDVKELSKRAVFVPTKADVFAAIKRGLRKIEPWYNWYRSDIFRLDAHERDFSDESEGKAFCLEIQWLGIHVAFELGRTPPKLSAAEVASRRAMLAAKSEA
jgi:hypothetical protein